MLFKTFFKGNPYKSLSEKIKTDLVMNFKRQGIPVRDIQVNLHNGDMNLRVLIMENKI